MSILDLFLLSWALSASVFAIRQTRRAEYYRKTGLDLADIIHGLEEEKRGQDNELLAALEAIIYASDGCRGHRECNHSMEPWQRARVIIGAIAKQKEPS